LNKPVLVFRYTAFACLATAANLGLQSVCLVLYGGTGSVPFAMFAGTAAGLAMKYVLDKHWIFHDREGGLLAHGRKFSLYTAMGLLTTGIFWGVEMTFALLFATKTMALVGGALGLALGYAAKYQLDRRFVFCRIAPA
jgi:putative flippase GtrA